MLPMIRRQLAVTTLVLLAGSWPARGGEKAAEPVSYFRDVRPLFLAHCQGCHQPAKARGGYVMTRYDKLIEGGDSGEKAIVPGQPAKSALVGWIQAKGQEAKMPKGKPALSADEVALVTRWIAQGARDDTPAGARVQYDQERPPVYRQAPVVTRLEYSPDGKLLAVAGHQETLLHKADGSGLVARLVGASERVEGLRFSPDGKLLAVTGGRAAQEGELQVWVVATGKLKLSLPVTFDTVAGPSWSPDGKLIAFGCADKSVRAVEVETGKQVLSQSTHEDRVLDTVFSSAGTHLVSVSGDMTAKLTEVATQRFVDNITSITPGALKGGIASVARHPKADVILIGGADGEPKLYHLFRQTARVIGDDANLIRRLPPLRGRINAVAISPDGRRFAAVSSLDGAGQVRVGEADLDLQVPPAVLAIQRKQMADRTPQERQVIEAYVGRPVKPLADVAFPQAGLYTVSFSPDGRTVAVAGLDGKVRLLNSSSGAVTKEFLAVPLQAGGAPRADRRALGTRKAAAVEKEALPAGPVVALDVEPRSARIERPHDTVQFVVTARLGDGEQVDVTRLAQKQVDGAGVRVSESGLTTAQGAGRATVSFTLGRLTARATVEVARAPDDFRPDFLRDVTPVLSKLGCNAGTCHGANKGKGGLKLSLRGNDAAFDVRAWGDELACRRVNFAAPDNSLLVLKASARVPHEGGRLTAPGEAYHELLRAWVAAGAPLDLRSPRVQKIDLRPADPIVQRVGGRQQFRVLATYTDGAVRDVTAESSLESDNIEVARTDASGLATTLRRGEAAILARYEGAYAATRLTVMGDRAGFVWADPPVNNFIDELTAAKWKRTKTAPSGLCSDAEFVRRAHLDLTGLPPTADDVRAFLADKTPSRPKRDRLIDALVGSPDFVEHWTNKWADLLQVNRKYLGVEGATTLRGWIRQQVEVNVPYDRFVHGILTASGSNRQNPASAFFKVHRDAEDRMETTTQLFLGLRFNCNKCHDHPFERWTQDQYWETAAFFARVGLKKDPASGSRVIGGSAVEKATPLFEEVIDQGEGEVIHDRTGKVAPPRLPYPLTQGLPPQPSRRAELSAWVTAADNRYFARSFVNRVWAYLMGVGLIEPIDDLRAGNPPSNPELLDRLTREFVSHRFDVRHLIRTICQSRTYQLTIQTNRWNEDDSINFSHAVARRLPAEVIFDALHRVTGSVPRVAGAARGARAAMFLDPAVGPAGGFLTQFGRPARESACECERSSGMQLGPVMAMVSGPTVGQAISDPNNELARLVAREPDDAKVIGELFLRILNRPATAKEIAQAKEAFAEVHKDHQRLVANLQAAEKAFAPTLARRQNERLAAIDRARAELAAYEKAIAAREADLDRQRQEAIRRAEEELRRGEADLPARLAAWEGRSDRLTRWVPLDPKEVSSTSATTLTRRDDCSVVATSSNGLGTYQVVARTELTGITAVRLEVLADPALPATGPGRSSDGNFVLSEFEVSAGPTDGSKRPARLSLRNAQADFSQSGFDVSTAIDGRILPEGNGWAIAPRQGVNHRACFEFESPVGHKGGTTFTFLLHQQFHTGDHSIGRFRLSVTTDRPPVLLDAPDAAVRQALGVPAPKRLPEQANALLAFYRGIDGELASRRAAVAAARAARPVDPTLKALREKLEQVCRPVAIDPAVEQMREEVAQSTQQVANSRLTAVQDLAWALLNSPAFLFNR